MKSLFTLLALFGTLWAFEATAQCNIHANAIPGITLQCAGGTGYRSGVAYNPIKDIYYSSNSGSSSYPIETFSSTGAALSTATSGGDYRGLWWNPNLSQLEGNAYGTGGLMKHTLDATTGYALNGVTNLLGPNQPTPQSVGTYDYDNDEIIYYDNGTIYRKDRPTNNDIALFSISGLPVGIGDINGNVVVYIGCSGREYGLLDLTNKRLLYINKSTQAYVDYTQLPVTAPTSFPFPNSQRMAYTNDLLWLFDDINLIWHSYEVLQACPAPVVSVGNVNDVNCFGDSTGTATGAATGGTGVYSFAWSNGVSTAVVNNLHAGTHTLTVTDSVNCQSDTTITILQGDSVSVSHTSTVADCFGAPTGTATVTASGGSGTLTYDWSNGAAGNQQNALIGGPYTVSITDDLGCVTLHQVQIDQPDSIALTIDEVIDATCEGGSDGSIAASTIGGVLPHAYQWNDPLNQVFATASNLPVGIYAVTVTDANNCTATNQANVSFINTDPNTSVSVTYNSNFSATLNATAGFSGYQWSNGTSGSFNTVGLTGTYTVTITDALGCTSAASADVSLWATGIESATSQVEVQVFPNPTSGIVNFSYPQGENKTWEASLFDALGQSIRVDQLEGVKAKLDYKGLASGQYLLRVSTPEQTTTFRLVLE